ncbi:MAG: HD domain-containing protein [Endomicrobium sp.]|nr:HD domain-containing protein [Endomicrobium sp.]
MNKLIRKINDLSQGYDVYAIGGFVRDLFLKRKHKDIDLTVNKNALKYSEKIAEAFKAKLVILDDKNKIYRIILRDNVVASIDISLFNGKTIEEDLQNRDFTVNAIAFNLKDFENFEEHIILPNKYALKDLKSKTLNTVSTKALKYDPLRMLRAFRFVAEYDFKLSKKILCQIKQNAKLINKVASERIKNEFFRVLSIRESVPLIDKMDKCGLLAEIFHEIKKMKKAYKKYYYHTGGLFQHSFETMVAVENILNNLQKYFPENYLDLEQHFEFVDSFSENITKVKVGLLKFVALFHDNAKPETTTIKNGKPRFLKHEQRGAEKIREIMLSLKFSEKDIEFSMFLVKHHMRPSTLTRNNIVTTKAALKFLRDIGDKTPDLLILSMSDWHSYKKLKVFSHKELNLQEKSARWLLNYYYKLKHTKPLPKIIDGNIIMNKFNLKPGEWIGELLKIAVEAQQEGKVSDTNEALKLLFQKLTRIKKKYNILRG